MRKDEIDALVRDFVVTELDEHRALLRASRSIPGLEARVAHEEGERERLRALVGADVAKNRAFWTQAHLEEFLERRGIAVDRESPLHGELMRALTHGWLDALNLMAAGDGEAEVIAPATEPKPTLPSLPAPVVTAPRERRVRPLGELVEPYITERRRSGIGASWETEIRTALAWMIDFFGAGTAVEDVTKTDFVDFKDTLLQLPSNWAKRKETKGLSIRDAAKFNRTAGLPLLEVEALKLKRFKPVADFFAWCASNGYTDTDPAAGITIRVAAKTKRKRDAFEPEDLQAIFASPIYTGAASDAEWWKPGEHRISDHRRWLPLLAAFSGARRGELVPLRTVDVVERDGIACLYIREHHDEDGEATSTVKTEDSWRLVPLHPVIIDAGFLDYVEARRAAGKETLFEVRSGDEFGKWFARFLDKLKLTSKRKVFHSFRHSFETAMREAIDDFDARCRITGREHGHSSAIYGKGHSARRLFEAISKISYPGLEVERLKAR